MATRGKLTLMFAFFVENLKFIEQFSSGHKKIAHVFFKFGRISIASHWDVCLVKLDEFFTSFFLDSKKRINIFRELIESIGTKTPDDHRIVLLSGWFSVNNRASKPFNKPRKNGELCVSYFKTNNERFVSSFSFRLPVFDSETSFCVNQTSYISKICSRWFNGFFNIFKRVKLFLVYPIIHMDFLFNFFNKIASKLMRRIWDFFSFPGTTLDNVVTDGNGKEGRFSFKNKIGFNLHKKISKTMSLDVPQPSCSAILSFFRSLVNSSFKFIKEVITYLLIHRTYLQRKFIDLNFWSLYVHSGAYAPVSICVSRQVCKFHNMNITGKLNYCQYPQRLTG